MAGIYFHIPFCKVKCSYCDFYKTTEISKINDFLHAIENELLLQKNYLEGNLIETIYFGGGTPSLLSPEQLDHLISICYSNFSIVENVEITIEANPDDIKLEYLQRIKESRVNRISIGVQSLGKEDLRLMSRRHNPIQAIDAIDAAEKADFNNISIDLIYGIPGMSFEQWQENLNTIFRMNIQHVSAYHLTYHEKTRLWDDLKKGIISEIDEIDSLKQFEELLRVAQDNGFIQYEISNFAKEGLFSKHNSSYWKQTEYLGLGPSAHSYNKKSRQWNVSSLSRYLAEIEQQNIPCEIEFLSEKDRFNDYIITSLRTMWGIDLEYLEIEFGKYYLEHIKKGAQKFLENGQLVLKTQHLILATKGIFISDSILSDLIV